MQSTLTARTCGDRPPDKEAAAPADTGTAVDQVTKAAELSQSIYPNEHASAILRFGNPDHAAASRMYLFALAGEDPDVWLMLSAQWGLTLAPKEIAVTAWAALRALDPELAEQTAASALGDEIDPLPPFGSELESARFWAGMASRRKLKAYLLAIHSVMHPRDWAAFLDHVGERRVAA